MIWAIIGFSSWMLAAAIIPILAWHEHQARGVVCDNCGYVAKLSTCEGTRFCSTHCADAYYRQCQDA
jgi:hypothetical protein